MQVQVDERGEQKYPDRAEKMGVGQVAWFQWAGQPKKPVLVLRTFSGHVDLEVPERTWVGLKGDVRILPPGSTVTLTVEDK